MKFWPIFHRASKAKRQAEEARFLFETAKTIQECMELHVEIGRHLSLSSTTALSAGSDIGSARSFADLLSIHEKLIEMSEANKKACDLTAESVRKLGGVLESVCVKSSKT